jgi:hypothetical protein
MATVTTGYTFVNNETVTPAKLNSLAGSATVTNIVNADVSASAAIADTKLATIATAGKVANSATTAASANTASAIVARDASGNFSAATVTATSFSGNLTGNVTGNVTGNLTGTASAIADGAVSTTAKLANSIVSPAKMTQWLTQGTSVATTSGTAIDFTGIPSWARRVTVMFSGVSTAVSSANSSILVQLGSSTGITTTGYLSVSSNQNAGTGEQYVTNGLVIRSTSSANINIGTMSIFNVSGNTWVGSYVGVYYNQGTTVSSGNVTLPGALDRIRITTVAGTDSFDAGSVNIMYEG